MRFISKLLLCFSIASLLGCIHEKVSDSSTAENGGLVAHSSFSGNVGENGGLVAHYSFSGNVDDNSGNGNNGVVNGAALVADRLNNLNEAYKIDDLNYIDLPHRIMNGIGDFTISLWVKFNTINEDYNNVIGAANSSQDNEFNLFYDFPNGFGVDVKGETYLNSYSGRSVEDNEWHFVVFRREGSVGVFFIDSVKSANQISVSDAVLLVEKNGLVIGQDQDYLGGGFSQLQNLSGAVDEIKIFNIALSDSEIYLLY